MARFLRSVLPASVSGGTTALAEARRPVVPLCDIRPGGRAVVVSVSADASPVTARRLEDLGFTAGTVVEVVRRAPLRDPVIYRLKDYDLCLRRAQSMCVLAREVHG